MVGTRHAMVFLAVVAALSSSRAAPAGDARVVLISVDGLRPDAITTQYAPRMTDLRARGTSAATAINDLPSATLPNHTTMLTGLLSDRHKVLLDFSLPGKVDVPTVFDFVREAGRRSAFFASKTKLAFLALPASVDPIDIDANTPRLVEQVLKELTLDGPDLVFLHIRDPDSAGHRFGWLSPQYLDAVTLADGLVGRIIDALDAEPDRDSFLILTADHGGDGLNHFINIPVNRKIPWIVYGPGITAGRVLDEVVSIADTAPTVLWLLGLDVPGGLSGVARTSLRPNDPAGIEGVGQAIRPIGPPCVILVIPAMLALAFVLKLVRAR